MPESAIEDRQRSQSSHTIREKFTFVDYDYLIKIVIVGDSGVGKSQLVGRFTRNEFNTNCRQTIGVEFATKTVNVRGKAICAQIWDTAGEERYRALASAYYRGAVGVLLVYDISNPRSYENLAHWLSEIKNYTLPSCQIILVGNKLDLKKSRVVEVESGEKFAAANNMKYLEVSALDSTNVEEAFSALIKDIYEKTLSHSTEGFYDPEKRTLQDSPDNESNIPKKCCAYI